MVGVRRNVIVIMHFLHTLSVRSLQCYPIDVFPSYSYTIWLFRLYIYNTFLQFIIFRIGHILRPISIGHDILWLFFIYIITNLFQNVLIHRRIYGIGSYIYLYWYT